MRNADLLALVTFMTGAGVSGSQALAQSTRSWVSGVGDDANPCTRTAPCKTFAGAISRTAAGGEINCMDAGGFGVLTITKAVTIICSAGEAGVLASGTDGIVINAGPTDAIILSGIDLEGLSGGSNGINFVSGGSLTLSNSSIRDFLNDGIRFAPNSSAALHVINTTIENSGQSAVSAGIYIQPSGTTTVAVTITQAQITEATYGIIADGSTTTGAINGVVRDSDISNNAQNGITVSNGTATRVSLMLDRISVSESGVSALTATGSLAGMLIGNSTIFGNHAGLVRTANAVLVSYGNNRINGNYGADGSFSSTISTE